MQQLEAFFDCTEMVKHKEICVGHKHTKEHADCMSVIKNHFSQICLKIHVAAIALSLLRMIMY